MGLWALHDQYSLTHIFTKAYQSSLLDVENRVIFGSLRLLSTWKVMRASCVEKSKDSGDVIVSGLTRTSELLPR